MEIVRKYEKQMADKQINDNELKELCKKYKNEIMGYTDNLNSKQRYYTMINMYVKKKMGETSYNISQGILRLTNEETNERRKRTQINAIKLLNNRIEIDEDKYMRTIDILKKSSDIFDIGACIALATGRRLIEVFKSGKFKKISENRVMFYGQAKRRFEKETPAYEIYVLGLTADELIKNVRKIRKGRPYDNMTNEEVGTKVTTETNRILRIYLGMTSEKIRSAYIELAYKKYANENMSKSTFGAKLLGHCEYDIGTYATHYDHTFIKKNNK